MGGSDDRLTCHFLPEIHLPIISDRFGSMKLCKMTCHVVSFLGFCGKMELTCKSRFVTML